MLEQGYASSSLTTESPGLQVCRQLLSWTDFKNLCEELAGKIDWKKYQAIFPVIRGGVYPAVELSRISGLPIVWELSGFENNLLVVDEICDSGATLRQYQEKEMDTAVLHFKDRSQAPTYYARKSDEWIVYPWETPTDVERTVSRQIEYVGDNPMRKELVETPKRVVQSWKAIYSGYAENPEETLKERFQLEPSSSPRVPVALKDYDFFSMSEDCLLPFWGTITVGFLPGNEVVKEISLAQLVNCLSRRLQSQDRMCEQIAEAINSNLKPIGVYVESVAQRLDLAILGRERGCTKTVAVATRGDYRVIMDYICRGR